MKLHNYQITQDYKVQEWLEKKLELSDRQREILRDKEIIRFAPFEFYERRKKIKNFWIRITIIVIPIMWLLLVISLPFNFIITGDWGYKRKQIDWYQKWVNAVGL